ncbi:glycine, alanine and asparagine-rich protein-like isoform X3 [Aphis craccivora]|uniref:Glycine, alanine and asparagine-rich protein-like isoform X3 n=1 Tax=Aphis craccivora TaxID=307492 RepID=A0A6G0ZI14_APHCR|nr:glycine, alanine and asparagine-rich protein-like isoform X3 [Aphis craccivora]
MEHTRFFFPYPSVSPPVRHAPTLLRCQRSTMALNPHIRNKCCECALTLITSTLQLKIAFPCKHYQKKPVFKMMFKYMCLVLFITWYQLADCHPASSSIKSIDSMIEKESEAFLSVEAEDSSHKNVRDKRTIGFLRQLFPNLSQENSVFGKVAEVVVVNYSPDLSTYTVYHYLSDKIIDIGKACDLSGPP